VEPIDPLSTDEAYESIGADMSDHDRGRSCAHLLPCILMNTRRRVHGVRGRAKPSLMISAELQNLFENFINQILNMEHIPMTPLAFHMWRCVC
jgi:hypothetical protein